jgi:hypothetical protein
LAHSSTHTTASVSSTRPRTRTSTPAASGACVGCAWSSGHSSVHDDWVVASPESPAGRPGARGS